MPSNRIYNGLLYLYSVTAPGQKAKLLLMPQFDKILSGGDLRSIGQVNMVVKIVNNQDEFDELFKLLFQRNRKLVMRAADAIEKITTDRPNYLQKHQKKVLELFDVAKDKELKWHLAQLAPRVSLSKKELRKIWQILTNWAIQKGDSNIVRVNSLQGLYDLQMKYPELEDDFRLTLSKMKKESIPSINARIQKFGS